MQLREPVRFTEQWERSASVDLREGKIAALADYAQHGRLRAGQRRRFSRRRLMRTWHTRWKAKTHCSLPVPMNFAARHAGGSPTSCSISALLPQRTRRSKSPAASTPRPVTDHGDQTHHCTIPNDRCGLMSAGRLQL